MKINALINKFMSHLEYRNKAEDTRKAYGIDVDKFITRFTLKDIDDVQSITTQIIEDYLYAMRVTTATRARRRSSIKAFYDFLTKKGYIQNNPATNLDSIQVSQKPPEYLSQAQYIDFINTIESKAKPYYKERDLTLVKLLAKTGLRRAEIVGLNVGDVDLSKLRLRVKRKGNRIEEVIIHHELAENLRKYLNIIERNADEPLFMSKRDKRLSASSVWHLVKGYSHKAGLNGNVTVHSLRHTFASSLLSQKVPLSYIQKLMGHKSPQTTARYLHIQDVELSETFNRVTFDERG